MTEITFMAITNLLKQFGLSSTEVQVYTYLVQKIEATGYKVSKDTGIPRATAYLALDKLVSLGLVKVFKKNKTANYSVQSTSKVLEIAQEKLNLASAIVPQLDQLLSESSLDKPYIELFTGKKGSKELWEDILEVYEKQKIKQTYAVTHMSLIEIFPKYFLDWVKRKKRAQSVCVPYLPKVRSNTTR